MFRFVVGVIIQDMIGWGSGSVFCWLRFCRCCFKEDWICWFGSSFKFEIVLTLGCFYDFCAWKGNGFAIWVCSGWFLALTRCGVFVVASGWVHGVSNVLADNFIYRFWYRGTCIPLIRRGTLIHHFFFFFCNLVSCPKLGSLDCIRGGWTCSLHFLFFPFGYFVNYPLGLVLKRV